MVNEVHIQTLEDLIEEQHDENIKEALDYALDCIYSNEERGAQLDRMIEELAEKDDLPFTPDIDSVIKNIGISPEEE